MAQKEEDKPLVGLESKKTGRIVKLTEEEAKQHMKLHGRRFNNLGPVEEFTPEEVTAAKQAEVAPKNSRKIAGPSAPDSPAENVAS
jgi:hypothetical protein